MNNNGYEPKDKEIIGKVIPPKSKSGETKQPADLPKAGSGYALLCEGQPNKITGGYMKEKIWYCSEKAKCKWQCFALHQGLGWGEIPSKDNKWRQWHDKTCKGELIQIQ